MGHLWRRVFAAVCRSKRRGVALLITMTILALLSHVVTDLSHRETIRYKLAIHHRDALKAELLASSGLDLAKLILVIQDGLQEQLNQAKDSGFSLGLPSNLVWNIVPLHSDLLRQFVTGKLLTALGADVSAALQKRKELLEQPQKDDSTASGSESSEPSGIRFTPPAGGFGAFDGSFSVRIRDENAKISLYPWKTDEPARKKASADRLHALFLPREYDDLFQRFDRWSLVGRLYDYTHDSDLQIDPQAEERTWGTPLTGSKSALYSDLVKPRNAFFLSPRELSLVEGMSDNHLQAFAENITIYPTKDNKINLLSASDDVLRAVMRYCAVDPEDYKFLDGGDARLLEAWHKGDSDSSEESFQKNAKGFVGFLKKRQLEVDEKRCESALGDRSDTFMVDSTGRVGGITVTLTSVMRAQKDGVNTYFFQSR